MNRWNKILTIWLTIVFCFAVFGKIASAEEPSIKALIVTGQTNQWHNWQVSSPILKELLEQTGLFEVDTAISPPVGEGIENFKPQFADYQVVVLDYDGELWSEQTRAAFVEYVKSGGGVVIYHSTDNAFPDWKQYNEIIGLGGWGERDEKSGPMVRFRDGKVVFDNSPGKAGSHPPNHEYQVVIRDKEHPITKGLPEKWMHASDELYGQLRGPAKNLTVLATAYSDPARKSGTGEHEPILFTINYGQGRVFHTVLGHVGAKDSPPIPSMDCVGFIVTFQRGAEWAATGEVTQKIPEDFPTATEVRMRKSGKRLSLDELLQKIAGYEFGQSRENLTAVEEIVRESYESEQQRKEIESRFVEFLRSDATQASKQFICKHLSIIGSEEAVPVLAVMLTEPETSDMARYALERIPGAAVDEALRKALPETTGKTKVGIINTLAMRGDDKSVDSLQNLIYDGDEMTASAAAAALGQIANSQATEALSQAREKTEGKLQQAVLDAYLNCADRLLARGEQSEALAIYEQLYTPDELTPVRCAALRGIATTNPEKATGIIIGILKGDDETMQPAAIELVREIPGTEIIKAATAELPNLSSVGRVQLLSALADRPDSAALPAIITATKDSEESVRIAALKVLASFGTAPTVVLLAHTAASTDGAEQQAARESLYLLSGPEVEKAIRGGIVKAEPRVKVELIRSIGKRGMDSEGNARALWESAQDSDSNVRLESIRTLRDIARPKRVRPLIRLLINAKDDTELSEVEKTMISVSRKYVGEENPGTAAILEALTTLEEIRNRCALLRVLGGIGDSKGLDALREALEDDNAEIQLAAVRALSDWPGVEAIDDLLQVAGSTSDETKRALAFRGVVRLIGLDSERSANETVKLYKQVMNLASNASEKKMILSKLSNVESFAALYLASDYLKDEQLQQEAAVAMLKIAESTRNTHPQQTKILLRMIIQTVKNDYLHQQVQDLINEIE